MSIDILALVEKRREQWDHIDSAEQALRALGEELHEAARSNYLGVLYRTDFKVSGRGAFPIDMLRYVNAWPANEIDTTNIENSIEQADANDPITITLTKYHRDPQPVLSDERWESKFRWKVLRKYVETVRL